jgi:ribonuclease P protein subunit POP4
MYEKMLAREELIGRHVTIRESTDPTLDNKSGLIIDETKNTFLIEIENKEKKVGKNIAKFEFEQDGKKIVLNGSKLIFRPEDRIKKVR